MTDLADIARAVARNLSRLRASRGLSLEQLAARSGVSKGMVIQVEQGRTNPSVGTLVKIADALGVSVVHLIDGADTPPLRVVRAGQGPLLWSTAAGSEARLLIGTSHVPLVELWRWRFAPGDRHASSPHPPGTFELLHVLEGCVTVEVDGSAETLGTGDAMMVQADRPHAYQAAGDAVAVLEMVVIEPNPLKQAPGGQ